MTLKLALALAVAVGSGLMRLTGIALMRLTDIALAFCVVKAGCSEKYPTACYEATPKI